MEKLIKIQSELKAPKGQFNAFGKYNYRNCEDILEALKPLLLKHNCCVTIMDSIIEVSGRVYVKATVAFYQDNAIVAEVSAFAREAEEKKGMDEAQITGSASSYARKYALNGMFLIDDTKDSDTEVVAPKTKTENEEKAPVKVEPDTPAQIRVENIVNACKKAGKKVVWADVLKNYKVYALRDLTDAQLDQLEKELDICQV